MDFSWRDCGKRIDNREETDGYSEHEFRGNGSTGAEMHNMFPYWETKVYNEVLKEKTIDGSVTFSRAGCAGAQSYSAFFNGDQNRKSYPLSDIFSYLSSSKQYSLDTFP